MGLEPCLYQLGPDERTERTGKLCATVTGADWRDRGTNSSKPWRASFPRLTMCEHARRRRHRLKALHVLVGSRSLRYPRLCDGQATSLVVLKTQGA